MMTCKKSLAGVFILSLVYSVASGQGRDTLGRKSESSYNYFLHVEVTDGVEMDEIRSEFSSCLKKLKYGFAHGSYVEGTGNSDGPIPSNGTIDTLGTNVIVGPFYSAKQLEEASEGVKECLASTATKLKLGPFGHWIIYFRLRK